MGVAILGECVRISWLSLENSAASSFDADDWTLNRVLELLEGQPAKWGFVAGRQISLCGLDLHGQPGTKARPPQGRVKVGEKSQVEPAVECWAGPGAGRWLILVQNASHCWASLRGVKRILPDEISFGVTQVVLPQMAPISLREPVCDSGPFRLIYPPPRHRERQAVIDYDGVLQVPFMPTRGLPGLRHGPIYRIGIVNDQHVEWLDVKPGDYSPTATPTTSRLRARLALFGRELASRGIAYRDDASETGNELHLEAQDHIVPDGFYEPEAPNFITVSGEDLESEKERLWWRTFDPDGDVDVESYEDEHGCGYFRMPASEDKSSTYLSTGVYGEVGGQEVTEEWSRANAVAAAIAAGLTMEGGLEPDYVALPPADQVAAAAAKDPTYLSDSTVDAADRVQRAAYVLATDGLPDPQVEASIARLRGAIVRALLGREGLRHASDGDFVEARRMAVELPPITSPPFPRRAYAAIDLIDALGRGDDQKTLIAETLAAIDDPLERRLAQILAAYVGDRLNPSIIEQRTAVWRHLGSGTGDRGFEKLTVDILESVLGPVDPGCIGTDNLVKYDEEAPVVSRPASEDRSKEQLRRAWTKLPVKRRREAVVTASRRRDYHELRRLLALGADPSAPGKDGTTPLVGAAGSGCRRCVEILLAAGADVNLPSSPARDFHSRHPLLEACSAANDDVVLLLLRHGADPRLKETDGASALQLALRKHGSGDEPGCKLETIETLIASGADVRAEDGDGTSVLHHAVRLGRSDVIPVLLSCGADINRVAGRGGAAPGKYRSRMELNKPESEDAASGKGWTPLMVAAANGDPFIVEMLLGRGAEPFIAGSCGRTALDVARFMIESDEDATSYDLVISMLEEAERVSLRKTRAEDRQECD